MLRYASLLFFASVVLVVSSGCPEKQVEPIARADNEVATGTSEDAESTAVEAGAASESDSTTPQVQEPTEEKPDESPVQTVVEDSGESERSEETGESVASAETHVNETGQTDATTSDMEEPADANDVLQAAVRQLLGDARPGLNSSEPNESEIADVEPKEPDVPAKTDEPDATEAGTDSVAETDDGAEDSAEPNEPDETRTEAADTSSDVQADVNEADQSEDADDTSGSGESDEPEEVAFHDVAKDIFANYVNKKGLVDYKTLSRRRLELIAVLKKFDELDREVYDGWSTNDKIAFWINAYNLQMLDIIAENYPIKPRSRFHLVMWGADSIRHLDGIWDEEKFLVMDEAFTLEEIEKRYFRKEFKDPRVWLALSRGSVSGPPLRREPYRGSKLDEQLDDQARRFLSDPLAFRIDRSKDIVYLSVLFQKGQSLFAYGSEFLKKYAIDRKFKEQEAETRAVLNFITRYVPDSIVQYLETENYTVRYIGYKWTVNEAP